MKQRQGQSKLNLCFSSLFYGLFFVALGIMLFGLFFEFNALGLKAIGVAVFIFILAIFSAFCEYGKMSKEQLRQYGVIPDETYWLCITKTHQ